MYWSALIDGVAAGFITSVIFGMITARRQRKMEVRLIVMRDALSYMAVKLHEIYPDPSLLDIVFKEDRELFHGPHDKT